MGAAYSQCPSVVYLRALKLLKFENSCTTEVLELLGAGEAGVKLRRHRRRKELTPHFQCHSRLKNDLGRRAVCGHTSKIWR